MRLVFVYNDKNIPRKFYGIIVSPVVTKERAAQLLTNTFMTCPNAREESVQRFVNNLTHDDKKWIFSYDHADGGRPFFVEDCDCCVAATLDHVCDGEEVMKRINEDTDNWLEFPITKEVVNA